MAFLLYRLFSIGLFFFVYLALICCVCCCYVHHCFAVEKCVKAVFRFKNKFKQKLNLEKWFRLEYSQSPVGPWNSSHFTFCSLSFCFSFYSLFLFVVSDAHSSLRVEKKRKMMGNLIYMEQYSACDCIWPSKITSTETIILVQRIPYALHKCIIITLQGNGFICQLHKTIYPAWNNNKTQTKIRYEEKDKA